MRLNLDLDGPADDKATPGERAVWLDSYLGLSTTPKMSIGKASFTVPAGR